MADEEGKDNPPRGNEWEVVSLSASAYAAAPGPQQVDLNEDSQITLDSKHSDETSSPLFMSRHFLFPPSQHENLPLEPEQKETPNEKGIEEDVFQFIKEDDETVAFKGPMPDELPGTPVLDDKGNSSSVGSFHSDAEEGEGTDDSIEPVNNSEKLDEGDARDGVDLPCEAWWKRRAICLYAHAKEANTFWSIFVAAAVMGFVIIGHQWQQERWKVLQLRQFGINDEKMGRMLGPIYRFKDVIVGGHRQGSLVRGGASIER